MSTQWLAIQSFQRGQNLLTAINTLSIHTKLHRAGRDDAGRAGAVAKDREDIAIFLESFAAATEQAESSETQPLLGLDPRFCQLAREFAQAKAQPAHRDWLLFSRPLRDMARLIRQTLPEQDDQLISCLAELRELIEQHVSADTSEILGEI